MTRGRILVIWSACAFVVWISALAQPDVEPAEIPAPSDESKPASVATPTSDAEANEAAQPLVPQGTDQSPRTGTGETMQPETVAPAEGAVTADQAIIPPEPSRKLWRISPLFSTAPL